MFAKAFPEPLGHWVRARKGLQQLKDKAGLCCLELWQGRGVM